MKVYEKLSKYFFIIALFMLIGFQNIQLAYSVEKDDPHETDMSVPLKGKMFIIKEEDVKKENGKISVGSVKILDSDKVTESEELSVSFRDKSSPEQIRRAVLKNLVGDSQKYSNDHSSRRPDHQHPRATIVSCSDSRCQIVALDQTPEEDLFVVRNIGNQFTLTQGSIWYGVNKLHTPLLLFVGHSDCGAIKAKLDGTEEHPGVPDSVKKELETLYVGAENKGKRLNQAIINNVHYQVEKAISLPDFSERIKSGKLKVMGAIYDFRDDFGRGANSLIFINVNGEKDLTKIIELSGLKGSSNPIIGVGDLETIVISPKPKHLRLSKL